MTWHRLRITVRLVLILAVITCLQYLHSNLGNLKRAKSTDNSKREAPQLLQIQNDKEDSNFSTLSSSSGLKFSSNSQEHEVRIAEENRQVVPVCPEAFEAKDSEGIWFRETFEQVSPYSEHAKQTLGSKDSTQLTNAEVVIMTPISNVRDKMKHYFSLLCSLTYPHDKISVVLGEDSSHDQTLYEAQKFAKVLGPYFRRIEILHLAGNQPHPVGNERHDRSYQFHRRKHLAMSRNQILLRGLEEESWVLWLDSDVRHIPVDLIQHLMSPGRDIVAANCLYKMADGRTDTFDRNTWQETSESLSALRDKPPDYLMLEGYGNTNRKFLNDLKNVQVDTTKKGQTTPIDSSGNSDRAGAAVELDGVGGCALLVRAELHVKGLNFPPYVFNHHIETEGFAKIAHQVFGVKPHGLPRVHVIHW